MYCDINEDEMKHMVDTSADILGISDVVSSDAECIIIRRMTYYRRWPRAPGLVHTRTYHASQLRLHILVLQVGHSTGSEEERGGCIIGASSMVVKQVRRSPDLSLAHGTTASILKLCPLHSTVQYKQIPIGGG